MALNCRIGKDLGGNEGSVIEVLLRNIVIQTEEVNENLSHDSQCPDGDGHQAPPEYKSPVLPLQQRALFLLVEWNN
jgi:hypothetical protein